MRQPDTQSYGPSNKRLDVLVTVSMLKVTRMGKTWEDYLHTVNI